MKTLLNSRRIAAAYQQEQAAILASTGIKSSSASGNAASPVRSTAEDLSQVEALSRTLGSRQGGSSSVPSGPTIETDYGAQNMQARKEAFLTAGRIQQNDDFLHSIRTPPSVSIRDQGGLGNSGSN